uniref:(northern house mosquito) hypothetical protein n=1 Tax=Culex pipiens TaxID=7175 RepID=A0A8D8N3J2_CULPI
MFRSSIRANVWLQIWCWHSSLSASTCSWDRFWTHSNPFKSSAPGGMFGHRFRSWPQPSSSTSLTICGPPEFTTAPASLAATAATITNPTSKTTWNRAIMVPPSPLFPVAAPRKNTSSFRKRLPQRSAEHPTADRLERVLAALLRYTDSF